MADDFLAGLGLGLIFGIPLAIGVVWFTSRSYNEGLKGKRLVSRGLILGWTEDGVPVFVPSFERGREVGMIIRNLEWRVHKLQEEYRELKAAYMVSQGRIATLEDSVEEIRAKIEELRRGVLSPDMKSKLEELISILDSIKKRQRKAPRYQIVS